MKTLRLMQISLLSCASLVSAAPLAHAAASAKPPHAETPRAAVQVSSQAPVKASVAATQGSTLAPAASNAGLALAINHELIRFNFSHGRPTLARGPVDLSLGFLGRNAADLFTVSASAQREAKIYHAQRVAGTVLTTIGTAAYIADLAFIIVRSIQDWSPGDEAISWGLLAGGLATSITGVSLSHAADGHLAKAVNLANEQTVTNILSGASPALGLNVGGGRVLASAKVSF